MAARGDKPLATSIDTKPPHQKSGEKIQNIFFHTHYIPPLHPACGWSPTSYQVKREALDWLQQDLVLSLLNTLRGSDPCNGSSNGGGVERRTAPASAKKEREEAGIFVLKKYEIKEFFFLFFSSRVIHLAGLSHRASSPFIISTDAPGLRSRRISDIHIHIQRGSLLFIHLYTHIGESGLSLHTHTHIQQQVPIFRCIAFLDG